jgi:translation elongation factor EF-Tu-like GTPase
VSAAAFRMTVRDLFTLSGLGVAVTGQIESGSVKGGDELDLVAGERRIPVKVIQIEVFNRRLKRASADDGEVAIVLSGVTREEVAPGQLLTSRADGE